MPCEDCGRRYGNEHGFPDLVISDEAWEAIMPDREGGGLLCPSCICARLSVAGLMNVPHAFRSGPLYGHEALLEDPPEEWIEAMALASEGEGYLSAKEMAQKKGIDAYDQRQLSQGYVDRVNDEMLEIYHALREKVME